MNPGTIVAVLPGTRFGRWTVLSEAEKSPAGSRRLLCRCDCGREKTVQLCNLRSGKSLSCSCVRAEMLSQRMTTHGHTRNLKTTAEYRTWHEIMRRCYNTKRPAYKDYGGRGISVCERWHTFANFFADMGKRPSDLHSIDRKDNNGNYEPGNCRWTTMDVQCANTRAAIRLEYQGETLALKQWAKRIGVGYWKLQQRHLLGWKAEQILANPPIPIRRKYARNARLLTHQGRTMSLSEWAREKGIREVTLNTRISTYGWSIERALTEPVRAHNRT